MQLLGNGELDTSLKYISTFPVALILIQMYNVSKITHTSFFRYLEKNLRNFVRVNKYKDNGKSPNVFQRCDRLQLSVTSEVKQSVASPRGPYLLKLVFEYGQICDPMTRRNSNEIVTVFVEEARCEGKVLSRDRTFTKNVAIKYYLNVTAYFIKSLRIFCSTNVGVSGVFKKR
jgi:hypothetical protein